MLQNLHDKFSGFLAKLVLGVIVVVFGGFFGLQSLMQPVNQPNTVATVNGTEITRDQFDRAYNNYRGQMQQMMGPQFDAATFDTPAHKRDVLDQLVNEELLKKTNEKLGAVVSANQVRDVIVGNSAFATDGKFDKDRYRMLLNTNGLTPAGYEDNIRKDLAIRQLPTELAQIGVVTDAQINAYLRLRDQTRDFSYIKLERPAADSIKITDADVDAYFKAHGADFMTPEKISLEYIELDAAKMQVDATPADSALKQRYEEQKARFTTQEQRLASHILVKVEKNANAEAQKAALEKAKAIAADAKSGKDFAALAKEKSDDLGSKNQGGDLGWLEKGVTDPAFETALYAMKKGEISDPVLSPEGYHIIDLRDVREGKVRPFEDVRAELAKQYLETDREHQYSDLSGKLTDAIYKDPSLDAAAKSLGLQVQKTAMFTRDGGPGIAANPLVLKAAFSNSVLNEGNTSDPIEMGTNHIVVVHLDKREAAAPKPLDAVRADIRKMLLDIELAKQAKEQADTLFARLQKGESLDQIATVLKLKVEHQNDIGRNAANVDSLLVAAAFKLGRPVAPDKPVTAVVPLSNDVFALLALSKVTDADAAKLDAKTRQAARAQLSQIYSEQNVRGFIAALRSGAKVEILEDRLQ